MAMEEDTAAESTDHQMNSLSDMDRADDTASSQNNRSYIIVIHNTQKIHPQMFHYSLFV